MSKSKKRETEKAWMDRAIAAELKLNTAMSHLRFFVEITNEELNCTEKVDDGQFCKEYAPCNKCLQRSAKRFDRAEELEAEIATSTKKATLSPALVAKAAIADRVLVPAPPESDDDFDPDYGF